MARVYFWKVRLRYKGKIIDSIKISAAADEVHGRALDVFSDFILTDAVKLRPQAKRGTHEKARPQMHRPSGKPGNSRVEKSV